MKENIEQVILDYLRGELDGVEAEELERWIGESEENRRVYEGVRKIAGEAVFLKGIEQVDKAGGRQRIQWRIEQRRRRALRLRWIKVAAAIALPLMIGLGVYLGVRTIEEPPVEMALSFEAIRPGMSQAVLYLADGREVELNRMSDSVIHDGEADRQIRLKGNMLDYLNGRKDADGDKGTAYNRIVVPRGGEYRLVLSDGTQVWLNSATELRYPVKFAGDVRQVELKGEAYFEVAKASGRRFQVMMDGVTIEVTGTSFNASCYPDDGSCSAVLASGSIRLLADGKVQPVKVGENAQYSRRDGKITVEPVNLKYYTSWRFGQFYFHDTSLQNITRQLGRWYDVEFEFADASLKEVCFSGVALRDKPIGYILKLLESTQFVKFTLLPDGRIRVDNG